MKKDENDTWFCESCGEENPEDAIICESCGERVDMGSFAASSMNSRKYEHEEFRKRFWKYKQQHPEMIKKFTRLIKQEMGLMLSPSGKLNVEDDDIPDVSAEEIIRMSMAIGMSCDELLDMMIEQSRYY